MPKRSKSHLVDDSTPGYSAETRQLRNSVTPFSVRGTSGVFVKFLAMDTLAVADDPGIIYKKSWSCKLATLIDSTPGIRGPSDRACMRPEGENVA